MAFHNIPPNGFPDIPDMEELEAVVKDVATLKSGLIGHVYGSFTPTASTTRGDLATALNAIFTTLSAEDKRVCKIVRNDGFVFVASGHSGRFISTEIGANYLQCYAIDLAVGKYFGWSGVNSTGEDMSDLLDEEGRTHYLVRG